MKDQVDSVRRFCFIQMQVLKERERRLRKELQECLLQKEFLTQIAVELGDGRQGE